MLHFYTVYSCVVRFLLGVEKCLLLPQVYVRIRRKVCHFSNCIFSMDNVLCICQLMKTATRRLKCFARKVSASVW